MRIKLKKCLKRERPDAPNSPSIVWSMDFMAYKSATLIPKDTEWLKVASGQSNDTGPPEVKNSHVLNRMGLRYKKTLP